MGACCCIDCLAVRDAERRRSVRLEHDRLWHENLVSLLLAHSVPNRLAGAEINEDGDAV